MPRFSDFLGGDDDEKPTPVRETPEDILDRLTNYVSTNPPTPKPKDLLLLQTPVEPSNGSSVSLDDLPAVDDDLLPRKKLS